MESNNCRLLGWVFGEYECTLVFGNRFTGATLIRTNTEVHLSIAVDLLNSRQLIWGSRHHYQLVMRYLRAGVSIVMSGPQSEDRIRAYVILTPVLSWTYLVELLTTQSTDPAYQFLLSDMVKWIDPWVVC